MLPAGLEGPPALTPESRTAAKRERQSAQIPGGCSIQQITSCKLLLKAEIWAGLCKFRDVYYLLLPGARAHLRAGCSSAVEDALETGCCWDRPAPPLLLLLPNGRWFCEGGGLSVFSSCVSRSPGVRCDGAIQARTGSTGGVPALPIPRGARLRCKGASGVRNTTEGGLVTRGRGTLPGPTSPCPVSVSEAPGTPHPLSECNLWFRDPVGVGGVVEYRLNGENRGRASAGVINFP